jgi:protein-S-isoprenylcysteine O-methyltransferase Ste14
MVSYGTLILISWAAFLLVWGVGAFNVKRDIRGGGFVSLWYRHFLLRLVIAAVLVFVALRFPAGTVHHARIGPAIFNSGVFEPPPTLGWVAAALTLLGIVFAIWARIHLGRNWSAAPAVKEKHELVVSGPYRFVRHPIYTGALLAVLGTALTGRLFAIGILILFSVMVFRRIGKEETIMLALFPNDYPAYQARTKKLMPFVW